MYNRLNTAYKTRIRKATLAIGHADLTDADSQQAFDFSAALPSDAYVIGRYIAVTEAFSDGESGTATMDVGIKSGNTDAFLDAADVSTATGNIDIPAGAVPSGHYGGSTPTVIVDGSVNLDTFTAGSATVVILYIPLTEVEA